MPEPNTGCWLWTGSLDGHGYGNFWFDGRPNKAHRASYALHKGSIPTDFEIDHLCRVPCCVNPEHLECVSHAVNCQRGLVNQHRGKTHCINGHLLDEANTWIRPKTGQRCCRECARRRDQEYRQRPEAKALALLRSQKHRLKAAALALLLLALSPLSARAAADVWLFYGAGPHGFSTGIDQIARRVRTLRGVETVHVSDYRDTQAAYDFLRQTRSEHSIAIVGYSCGGNASLAVGGALRNNHRPVHVIMLQPSVWCGRYSTTDNMRYVQDTWSYGTGGLGSYQPEGPPAGYTMFIQRPDRHLYADEDPLYQRDAVFAVGAVADPSRRYLLERHLQRSAPYVDRQDAQVMWRRE